MAAVDGMKAKLYEQLHCRQPQVNTLLNLFGNINSHAACPSIFIFGHSAVGKTFTVTTILNTLQVPHAIINCVECYTPRLLFELLLNRISEQYPTRENDYGNFASCDNVNDFVRFLKRALDARGIADETFYIVLDNAEYLRQIESNVLSVFLRLQELMRKNICVIFISKIVWDKFRVNSGFQEPVQLHFRQYTKDELCLILLEDCPADYSVEFYETYLQIILDVFYAVCCNLVELRYLAKQNFPKYVEPIVKGVASESNFQKLWRNIEPQLKRGLHSVYLRESIDNSCDDTEFSRKCVSRVELPFYSKFLLIAAYLASYNPVHTDRRFFLKRHDKVSKRVKKNIMKRHERVSNHLLGPKAFALDRLLAIFYSVIDERVSPSAHIFSQISSLVTLNLLSEIGKSDLDSSKYKCNVSLNFIRSVASLSHLVDIQ